MTRLAACGDPWSLALAAMLVSCAWFVGAHHAAQEAPTPAGGEDRLVRVRADALSTEAVTAPQAADGGAPWDAWIESGSRPVPAVADDPAVTCFAVRTRLGAVLVVRNVSDTCRAVRVAVRMPAGAFSTELVVQPATGPPRAQRLRSVVAGAGNRVASAWLPSGASAAFRWVDRRGSVAASYRSARQALAALRPVDAALARRVGVPLTECGSHVAAGLRRAQPATRDRAVRQVHRALFTASHAVMLARNARPNARSRELRQALEALEVELSELSAALLDLAPNVAWVPSNAAGGSEQAFTVSMTNYGRLTVDNVRFSLRAEGATVRPVERVMLGTLAPGQSARATFRVRPRAGEPLHAAAYVGYRTARSPARLRLPVLSGVAQAEPSNAPDGSGDATGSAATPAEDPRATPAPPGEETSP